MQITTDMRESYTKILTETLKKASKIETGGGIAYIAMAAEPNPDGSSTHTTVPYAETFEAAHLREHTYWVSRLVKAATEKHDLLVSVMTICASPHIEEDGTETFVHLAVLVDIDGHRVSGTIRPGDAEPSEIIHTMVDGTHSPDWASTVTWLTLQGAEPPQCYRCDSTRLLEIHGGALVTSAEGEDPDFVHPGVFQCIEWDACKRRADKRYSKEQQHERREWALLAAGRTLPDPEVQAAYHETLRQYGYIR